LGDVPKILHVRNIKFGRPQLFRLAQNQAVIQAGTRPSNLTMNCGARKDVENHSSS
jgi:hypothetical protein